MKKDKITYLNEKIERITNILKQKTDTHTKALEYRQYKNNSHIIIGTMTFIATNYFAVNAVGFNLLDSFLISLIPTTMTSLGSYRYFFNKRKKIQKENPTVDFEQYNIDENDELIITLHNEKMLLVDELINVKNEIKESTYTEIQNVEEKSKIKVMTLTRKK